ncbi:MAG: hypothetical protein R2744_10410 [Bacteroidales bacterium]
MASATSSLGKIAKGTETALPDLIANLERFSMMLDSSSANLERTIGNVASITDSITQLRTFQDHSKHSGQTWKKLQYYCQISMKVHRNRRTITKE